MNLEYLMLCLFSLIHYGRGQSGGNSKRLHLLSRPVQQSSSPCGSYDGGYDSVDEERSAKTVLLAAAGGAALGYHFGTKTQSQNQPSITNNIYNDYPQPCVVLQDGGGGGGGGGGGIFGGGGILSHHPILSNIIQGGWQGGWQGGGGNRVGGLATNRGQNINWNRAIRQFSRVIRPLTRGFR
ncbi:hypothetical protein RUM44_004090 [Polyplax serrata]|uniref:Uncharacterized protein n=1 Tax=Polyplax serrata TaxID=468196 RepID=A0ABR1B3E1_POLSC